MIIEPTTGNDVQLVETSGTKRRIKDVQEVEEEEGTPVKKKMKVVDSDSDIEILDNEVIDID